MGRPWVGFDFDGTLVTQVPNSFNPARVGETIGPVLDILKQYLADGVEVRIVSARVAVPDPLDWNRRQDAEISRRTIELWCVEHTGVELPITCSKDMDMICLYDDRARQVISNTGLLFPIFPTGVDYAEQGTPVSGYQELGPYSCHDCDHNHDGNCHHPLVMLDPRLLTRRNPDGTIRIKPTGCCRVVNQSDHGTRKSEVDE